MASATGKFADMDPILEAELLIDTGEAGTESVEPVFVSLFPGSLVLTMDGDSVPIALNSFTTIERVSTVVGHQTLQGFDLQGNGGSATLWAYGDEPDVVDTWTMFVGQTIVMLTQQVLRSKHEFLRLDLSSVAASGEDPQEMRADPVSLRWESSHGQQRNANSCALVITSLSTGKVLRRMEHPWIDVLAGSPTCFVVDEEEVFAAFDEASRENIFAEYERYKSGDLHRAKSVAVMEKRKSIGEYTTVDSPGGKRSSLRMKDVGTPKTPNSASSAMFPPSPSSTGSSSSLTFGNTVNANAAVNAQIAQLQSRLAESAAREKALESEVATLREQNALLNAKCASLEGKLARLQPQATPAVQQSPATGSSTSGRWTSLASAVRTGEVTSQFAPPVSESGSRQSRAVSMAAPPSLTISNSSSASSGASAGSSGASSHWATLSSAVRGSDSPKAKNRRVSIMDAPPERREFDTDAEPQHVQSTARLRSSTFSPGTSGSFSSVGFGSADGTTGGSATTTNLQHSAPKSRFLAKKTGDE